MKKLLFILSISAFCFLVSCNNDKKEKEGAGGTTDAAKKNMDAFNTVSDAFKTGDVSKIDGVVAGDFVDHSGMHGDGNRDSLKAMITMMSMDKTAKSETKLELANDDYVTGWLHMTGTNDGSMGPKGTPYDMSTVEIVKFNKDGKATDHWSFISMGDMMKMMPPPPAEKMIPAKDAPMHK
jgi:predicted SnoaL-like aldol condensation-catalyzing enzyme